MSESLKLAKQFLGQKVDIEIDRPLGSRHPKFGFFYELNYGFVPSTPQRTTIAPDGEALDAYIIDSDQPLEKAQGRCIAIIHRLNDDDDKLIISVDQTEIRLEEIKRRTYFQEQFFDSKIILEAKDAQ